MSDGLIEWAHQGGAKEAPSNTLMAMHRALRSGRPNVGLELDVHRTSDGKLVVIHDRTLPRTTNGHGRVRRHMCGNVQGLNAAWWWTPGTVDDHRPGARHPGRLEDFAPFFGVPTLTEILDLRSEIGPNVPLTIEIKSFRAAKPLVDLLHERLSAGDQGPITVTSFFDPILWRVRWRLWHHDERRVDLAPATGYMLVFWVRAVLGLVPRRTRYARLQLPIRKVVTFATPRLILSAQRVVVKPRTPQEPRRCLQVDMWTIDDRDEMDALIALGVDGIMSDRPSVLAAAVDAAPTSAPAATGA